MNTADYIACGSIVLSFLGMAVFTYYKHKADRETAEQYKQRLENVTVRTRTILNDNPNLKIPQ